MRAFDAHFRKPEVSEYQGIVQYHIGQRHNHCIDGVFVLLIFDLAMGFFQFFFQFLLCGQRCAFFSGFFVLTIVWTSRWRIRM